MAYVGDRYYLMEGAHLARLRRIAERLFTEERMSGDEMRDVAQTIEAIVNVCAQQEAP